MLEELNTIVESAGLPVETGVFSTPAPDAYVVITPIAEHFELFADNTPGMNIEEARLSLFSKGNYGAAKDLLVRMLLSAGFLLSRSPGWPTGSCCAMRSPAPCARAVRVRC